MNISIQKQKGDDMPIHYGVHSSPFGWCVLGVMQQDICHLSFMDSLNLHQASKQIEEAWPRAILKYKKSQTTLYLKKIFKPTRSKPSFRLLLNGTDFQIKVWKALLAIPKGEVTTYTKVARKAGFPKAIRAVGTACGKNPIGFLIPCHRVLTSNGKLGGYRWGINRKKKMLALESAK